MGLDKGSLVWVQRKNGSWWPGKVVGIDETSCPLKFLSPSAVKTPIKLLGRENGSVEWHDLETSKRVKAFRSSEFDGFIKNAESVEAIPIIKIGKYAHREDAVLHALQLEKQEREKGHKTAATGNEKQGAVFRAKRSKCVYLPVKTASSENSVLDSQSSKAIPSASVTEEHYQVSSVAEEKASSESRVSDFSESIFEDNGHRVNKQHTGSYGNRRQMQGRKLQKEEYLSHTSESSPDSKIACAAVSQNSNLNGKPCEQNPGGTSSTVSNGTSSAASRKRSRDAQDILLVDSPCKEDRSYRFETKSDEHLVKSLLHTPAGGNYLEDSDILCCSPVHTNHNMMDTMLIDVDITVQASYRKEHVPLVSLMSKSNNRAIIGHPIEVEALEDNPEIFLVKKKSSRQMVHNACRTVHQLVWITSKRNPVCYITNPHSPATNEKGKQASKTFGNSGPEAKTNKFSKGLLEKNGDILQTTCIAVEMIFSKLLSAVGA